MPDAFETALLRGVTLLQQFPRGRDQLNDARSRMARFKEAHAEVPADLVIHQPPGSARADFDLLLEHPDGGTVALSWHADEGVPWCLEHADHWAANLVLSVNGSRLTVQQAILCLKLAADRTPRLMDELVGQKLIAEAIEADPPTVTEEEVQQAANRFRAANGLFSAAETHRWLEETGLTEARFAEILCWGVQARKLRERITAAPGEAYFLAHRNEFDQVRSLRVIAPTESTASTLARTAREAGLLSALCTRLAADPAEPVEATLECRHARDLPAGLRDADPGTLVGPFPEGTRYWVAEVLERLPAQLDSPTRAAIQEILFREWLAERRKSATIRWYWIG